MNAPDNASAPPRSTTLRPFRWLFRWRTLRWVLLGFASLATLIALVVTVENWRGRRAWEAFRKEWEAKGERFDLASFIPGPVPDDQNFAMTPFFAPILEFEKRMANSEPGLTNAPQKSLEIYTTGHNYSAVFGAQKKSELTDLSEWQKYYRADTNIVYASEAQTPAKDVLFALERFNPVLTELREASRRRYAVFPLHLDRNPMVPILHLGQVKSVLPLLRLRVVALLAEGRRKEALEDVRLGFRLADSLRPEPFLISALVRIAILTTCVDTVWEGLARHQWTDAELVELQQLLGSINLLADYGNVMRGERAGSIAMMSWIGGYRHVMKGLLDQNKVRISSLYQLEMLPLVDAPKHRVHPTRADQLTNAPGFKRVTPYNFMARLLIPAVGKACEKTARAQALIDQALVACALERYRLANGRYPDELKSIVPAFIQSIPPDVATGEPLHYRRIDDKQFLLYSVGWNQKDDGGTTALGPGKSRSPDDRSGDWVWRYPSE